ncbi:unnamed protein product [Euphydryas editha]|uniref:RBD domain-containing protein n=1 Tax=Euphydryas editha TaxID=104508 RepID=A0AAU9U913_EUPED|nr:unnamed protein product [Euphydryas editha]
MIEVVKSSQSGNGSCSLCRVVLPDGATSVVGVDDGVTVRRLVDRLLQRRNLPCASYDVLVRDALVDCGAPSSALGGREARVERRVVLRVSVGSRAVAVRCRPARRLRHVLRPVLQRYLPAARAPAALLAGAPLHPDTPVAELDGARIRVVETAAAPELALDAADDDGDSLSDVALRLQDDCDDSQSQSASRSSVSSTSSVSESGRVRAALRAGPPLHHHPPDFLDNLRETQKQRLQPRTPPPLPPKPAQRAAPTVV